MKKHPISHSLLIALITIIGMDSAWATGKVPLSERLGQPRQAPPRPAPGGLGNTPPPTPTSTAETAGITALQNKESLSKANAAVRTSVKSDAGLTKTQRKEDILLAQTYVDQQRANSPTASKKQTAAAKAVLARLAAK